MRKNNFYLKKSDVAAKLDSLAREIWLNWNLKQIEIKFDLLARITDSP